MEQILQYLYIYIWFWACSLNSIQDPVEYLEDLLHPNKKDHFNLCDLNPLPTIFNYANYLLIYIFISFLPYLQLPLVGCKIERKGLLVISFDILRPQICITNTIIRIYTSTGIEFNKFWVYFWLLFSILCYYVKYFNSFCSDDCVILVITFASYVYYLI